MDLGAREEAIMATTTEPEQAMREAEARGWRVGWEQAKQEAKRELEQAKRELEQAKHLIERQKLRIEDLLEEKCEALADLEQFKKDRENWKMRKEQELSQIACIEKDREVEALNQAHIQELVNLRRDMEEREYKRKESLRRALDRVEEQEGELETLREQEESHRAEIQRMRHLERERCAENERIIARLERRDMLQSRQVMDHHEEIQRLREAQNLSTWEKKDLKIMMSGLFQLIKSREDEGEVEVMSDTFMNTMANLLSKHWGEGFEEEVEPIRDALETTMEGLFLLSEDQEEEVEQEKVIMNNGDYLRMTDKLKRIYQLRVERLRVDYHQ